MFSSRALAVAALAATTAVAVGCTPTPGTAAIVDGEVITASEVAVVVEELGPLLSAVNQPPSPYRPSDALADIIFAEPVLGATADAGLGVSAQDARATAERVANELGIEQPELSEASLEVMRYRIITGQIATVPNAAEIAADIEQRVADQDITVSPRYEITDAGPGIAQFPWIEYPWAETAQS
ncbi:MAG: hypothetical protein ACK5KU_02375 [Beutenbergiaceae bacterium]